MPLPSVSTTSRSPLARPAVLAVILGFLLVQCATAGVPGGSLALPPPDLRASAVSLRSGSGSTIDGWFSRGRAGAGAVLLLHGIGASRLDMVGRARFLEAAGYSVLLIDFRGHGESGDAQPTYGALESRDARAALAFLRTVLPDERIGVIGVSMGGAAALLGPAPLAVDALVLESVYPTIRDAVRDRLRAWLGPLGGALVPGAMAWLFPRSGVTPEQLRPIDRIAQETAPVFVLAGTADRYTTLDESRALFDAAPEPKAFWAVEGAAHVDLHAFTPAEYEARVGAFLADHLRRGREGLARDEARGAPR
ncbi:alpha/beta hydrolase [Anaeromyxobacter oryzae]|uniref:Esterase n=1 Tax=Anaeromyxobacter oryzae TaxID=2918170 RepID=A0ABM7WRY2_9BACT|nr:alpha/beta fold hydrolase [Anaeromyxobacter oryzae]BDG02209.1 esterase [Anaeromyxobacter oryzae]